MDAGKGLVDALHFQDELTHDSIRSLVASHSGNAGPGGVPGPAAIITYFMYFL